VNIAQQLLASGAPDATAILAADKAISYEVLRQRVDDVAIEFLHRGYLPRERIGIWSENSIFFIVAYLGAIRAGLVAVPLQTDCTRDALLEIVNDTAMRTILSSDRHSPRLHSLLSGSHVRVLDEKELEKWTGTSTRTIPEVGALDLAAILFTSGSTGRPKGVMVTHQNIACNTSDIISYMQLQAADRVMVVLPFHYCFGLSLLHTHLAAGASLVLNNTFLYPEKVLQDMQAKQCTGFAGVPSTYQILLRKSRFKDLIFPRLRWLQQAGGKLPNAFIQEILTAFPHVRFFLMYGQTEGTARLSYLPPERLRDKLGSIGKGLPSTRLEVLRSDGTPVTPGSDEVGEIVASGENITLGYWNDPVETARYFRNGRLHTGDLARVDCDGFIFVVERERDMIKCGGNRVSAKEIEDVISEIADVIEVAVVGAGHEILGEVAVAYVASRPKSENLEGRIVDYCKRKLPSFKVPEQVICLPQLPHGPNGKVLKSELKRMTRSRSEATPISGSSTTITLN
jgi:acyl-CoA synthetase (AMP-forming)/AMP-acid ligase II